MAVRAYVLRRTGPEHAADVVAETFAVAWRRWADVPALVTPVQAASVTPDQPRAA